MGTGSKSVKCNLIKQLRTNVPTHFNTFAGEYWKLFFEYYLQVTG